MEEERIKTILKAIRRGIALGLSMAAAWCVSLTLDVENLDQPIEQIDQRQDVSAALLSHTLGSLSTQEQCLSGWGRILLDRLPLLAEGEQAVMDYRNRQCPTQPEQIPSEHDNDDQVKPNLTPPHEEDDILEMTAKGQSGGKYLFGNGVYLYNRSELELDASVLSEGTVDIKMGQGPHILIVHTHGSEAFSQSDGDVYEESDPYRSTDCTHNIVRVGEEMATVFRAHGFQVLHDTNLYDYPSYNGSYDRSKAAVEHWLTEYPTIQIVLDVHRDALVGKEGQVYKLISEEAGHKVAQVMLVLGSSGGGAAHPRWKDNLALAVRLQQGLTTGYQNLARPIVLRKHRFNQQLLPGALLVEVGGHGNTLTEAIDGARLWADNVARTLLTYQ